MSRASKAIRVLLRPVAAIIAFFAAFSFRRGGKGGRVLAATAQSAGDTATTATSATTVVTQVSHTASMFAPLVETAQAVAIQAPQAMPLISKAAIGLGMVVVATSPATAPIVIDQFRETSPAPVTAQVDAPQDAAAPVTTAATPSVDAAPASTPADVSSGAAPPSSLASNTPANGAADPAVAAGSSSSGSGAASPATTAPSITRSPGSLSVASLSVVQSGPRLDVSGSASITAGGQSVNGTLSGRLSLSGTPDARGRQRLDASFTIATADGPIEIRLAGFAVAKAVEPPPTPAEGEAPATTVAPAPTAYTLSGVFRATAEKFGLITSGSATGTLGSGLSLTLSA